jgi:hypothetical protein
MIECDFGCGKCLILKEKIFFQNASLNFTADIQNASLKNKKIAYTLRKVPKFDRFRRV